MYINMYLGLRKTLFKWSENPTVTYNRCTTAHFGCWILLGMDEISSDHQVPHGANTCFFAVVKNRNTVVVKCSFLIVEAYLKNASRLKGKWIFHKIQNSRVFFYCCLCICFWGLLKSWDELFSSDSKYRDMFVGCKNLIRSRFFRGKKSGECRNFSRQNMFLIPSDKLT